MKGMKMTQATEKKKREPVRRSFLLKAMSSLVGASAWGPQTVAASDQSSEEKNPEHMPAIPANSSSETIRQEEY